MLELEIATNQGLIKPAELARVLLPHIQQVVPAPESSIKYDQTEKVYKQLLEF